MFLRDTIGISTLVEKENKTDGGYLSDIAEAPLALGALSRGASLLEMTAAYTMFPRPEYVRHLTFTQRFTIKTESFFFQTMEAEEKQ